MPKKKVHLRTSGKHKSDGDEEWVLPGNRVPNNQAEKRKARKSQASDGRQVGKPQKNETFCHESESSPDQEDEADATDQSSYAEEVTAPCVQTKVGAKRSHEASEEEIPVSKRSASDIKIRQHLHYAYHGFLDCERELLGSKAKIIELESKVKGHEDELKRLENENQKNTARVLFLETENAKLETQKMKVAREYQELEKAHDIIRGEAIQALEEAEITPNHEPSPISVDSVVKQWRLLRYNIYNSVAQHLTGTPRRHVIPEDSQGTARIIEICSKSPEMQAPLLERYIWKRLSMLWKADSEVWAGKMGQEHIVFYNKMRERHVDDPRALCTLASMKAVTAQTIDFEFGLIEGEKQKILQDVLKRLKPFQKCPDSTDLNEDLSKVLEYAIDLTKWFMMARNMYHFGQSFEEKLFERIPYNKATMKIIKNITEEPDTFNKQGVWQEPNLKVRMVMSPALYVTGSEEGEHFDSTHLLCKARVAVSLAQVVAERQDGNEVARDNGMEADGPM